MMFWNQHNDAVIDVINGALAEIAAPTRRLPEIHAERIGNILDRLRGDKEAEIAERECLIRQIENCRQREADIDLSIAAFELAHAKLAGAADNG